MNNEKNEEISEEKNNLNEKESLLEKNPKMNSKNQNLITILNLMSIEYPLSDLAEKIESETDGIFTFKQLYKIIDKYYKKISKKDKKNLIKNLSLIPLDIHIDKPFISIFALFNHFSNLLNIKILSPSLILYEIALRLKNIYKKSTLEFFISNNFESSGEINLEQLINLFNKQLNIDENLVNIFYDMINYNNKNTIKIENIILTIDSFRDDNNNINETLNENDKNILFLNVILDKVFINMDKIFKKEKNEYMKYSQLKKILMQEISKNNKYFNYNEYINENLLDEIFNTILKEGDIYYSDYKNELNKAISKLTNKKIKLNNIQKFWINKYIDILLSQSIEPKNISEENESIKLKDIQKLLLQLNINIDDINNIINALDINQEGVLDNNQYETIINIIMKEKESLAKLNYFPNNDLIDNNKSEIKNMWECGLRPNYYYLLPFKGNEKILSKLNKNIKSKKLLKNNNNTYNTNIIYKKNEINENDKLFKHEYNDEYFLKIALENFNFNKNKFPCFDLLNYLLEKDFSNKYISQITKFLDKDNDGYIDIIDIIKFLLRELKYKSTKLVFKYLYIRIYQEMNLNSSEEFFKMYNLDLNNIIDAKKFIKIMNDLNIDFPLTKQILYELNIIYNQPLLYVYISDQIDFYKKNKIMNNTQYMSSEEDNNYINYNTKKFEQEIISNIKQKDFLKNEFNLIINKCDEIMNYSQYIKSFVKPLGFNGFFGLIVFQLLKTFSKKGEQIISKNDLLIFFNSYSFDKDINKKSIKKKDIKEILKNISKVGAPLKYAFEIIPFRINGLIPSSELIKYLCKFYGDNIQKNDLMNIIFFIDSKKKGIVSYDQIQQFLNKYCKIFSELIELQIISCNISKYNFSNAEKYFNNNKIKNVINDEKSVKEEEHNLILNNLCSNDINKKNLFIYLANNENSYDLIKLIDLLNYYLELDSKKIIT